MSTKEKLTKIINHYGSELQLDIAIEEMSELTKEICKYKRGKQNVKEIAEEMADVYVILDQLRLICEIPVAEIENIYNAKIERTLERMEVLDENSN